MAAVSERDAGPDPLLAEHARPVEQPIERLRTVDHQPPGHPEANTQGGTVVGVEEEELAPSPGLGEDVAGQRALEAAWSRATSPVPGVDHPDLLDGAPERLLGQPSVQLDLQNFGHAADGTGPMAGGRIWWANATREATVERALHRGRDVRTLHR